MEKELRNITLRRLTLFWNKVKEFIDTKAAKDSEAIQGNIAVFDDSGNPMDSGVSIPVAYKDLYLTFEALEDGIFLFTPPIGSDTKIYYSKNGGEWINENSVQVVTGDKVRWKGSFSNFSYNTRIGQFGSSTETQLASFIVYGNIMSLIHSDSFKINNQLSGYENFARVFMYSKVKDAKNLILPNNTTYSCYNSLFADCTYLINAPELPTTTLETLCYADMFHNCTNLLKAPDLLAAVAETSCYLRMFEGCTSLTESPKIELTTLNTTCCEGMFRNCTNLIKPPLLKATILSPGCYIGMFENCTSLTKAPDLIASEFPLSSNVYYLEMFKGCSNLSFIKALFISLTTHKGEYRPVRNWTTGVAATGILIKNDNATWNANIVPSGWTVYTESEWEVVRHYELGSYYTKPNEGIPMSDLSEEVLDAIGSGGGGGEENVIESIKVNDVELTVEGKAVNITVPTLASDIGALPDSTPIPTKTSQLSNDSGFLTEHQSLKTINNESITGSGNINISGSGSVHFGSVDANSTASAFSATVSGVTELADGVTVYITNNVATANASMLLDVNELGAKPVYTTAGGRLGSGVWNSGKSALLVYNSTRVSGGCWDYIVGEDTHNNNAYNVRGTAYSLLAKETLYRYQICFTYSDTEILPSSRVDNSMATTKELTTLDFNPFGRIYYYDLIATINAGALAGATSIWYQSNASLRYAFNVASDGLTSNKAVYVKCEPLVDASNNRTGRVRLASGQPIVQDLPTMADGFVYIYLGIASSTSSILLELNHPVYEFKDGAIRLWTNNTSTSGGGSTITFRQW